MKLIIPFCLFVFNSLFLLGQETGSPVSESPISIVKEYGLDATFINKFLPFENEIGKTNDYLFSYRMTKSTGKFTRVGFDVDFGFSSEINENQRDQSDSRIGFDFRVGGGKSRAINKRFTLFTGFDWTLGLSYTAMKVGNSRPGVNDDNSSSTTAFETGLGPFIGLQFNFNDKLGVYTEADFYANFIYEIDRFESGSLPGLDSKNEKTTFSDKIALPGTLVLFYRFN